MPTTSTPRANPLVVLREEADNWAILFQPDTGESFAIDPVAVFIWKRLDGRHTLDAIVAALRDHWEDVPEEAEEHCRSFIEDLIQRGLAA